MAHFFNLAWRNIQRNKRRTIITASAIVVGVTMMIFTNGLITGLLDRTITNSVELETGHIKVYALGYREKSDLIPTNIGITNYTEVLDLTDGVQGVNAVSPRIRAGGMLHIKEETTRVIINGITEQDLKVRDLKKRIIQGEYFTREDENVIIIGEPLADRLTIQLHDKVLLSCIASDGTPVSMSLTVKALFSTQFSSYDSTMVFLPLRKAQDMLKMDGITEIVVMIDNPEKVEDVTADIASTLQNKGYTYEVLHWEELAPELAQFAEMEKSMSFLFMSIVVIVAAIGILNTMLMAVYERIKEVGVMAAFGYKSQSILVLFMLEGLIIGVIGAVIGCILGLGITYYLSQVGMTFAGADVVEFMESHIYPRLSALDVVFPFFFAVTVTLLAALYPAYRASQLEPVEALRHV